MSPGRSTVWRVRRAGRSWSPPRRRRRRQVRLSVVLAATTPGAPAERCLLRVTYDPRGPASTTGGGAARPGQLPLRAQQPAPVTDRSFDEALDAAHAWAAGQAGYPRGGELTWRLTHRDGRPVTEVGGGSLGASMATALSFLLILHKSARRPVDPEAVLSATVDPAGLLGPVSHIDTKVTALAAPRLRLGLALADHGTAERARPGSQPALSPLVSVAEAVRHTRLPRSWRLAAVVMASVTALGTGGWAWHQQDVNARARQERGVSDLLARTDAALSSAPECAASFALRARELRPGAEDTRARLLAAAYSDPRLRDVLPLDAPGGAVAYTPDGRSLAVAAGAGVRVYDAGGKKLLARMPLLKNDQVTFLVPLGDRGLLAMATSQGTVRLWDPAAPASPARLLADEKRELTALAASPDGARLAWSGADPTVTVTTIGAAGTATAAGSRRLPVKGSSLNSLAFTSAETLVVGSSSSQSGAPSLQALDLTGRAPLRTLQLGGGPLRMNGIGAIAVQPSRHRMLTGNIGGTLKVWDTRTMKATRIPQSRAGRASGVGALALSTDGRTALVARNNGVGPTGGSSMNTVQAWDLEQRRPMESTYFGSRFAFTAFLALRPATNEASIITTSAAVTFWRPPRKPTFDRPVMSVLTDPLHETSALVLDFDGTLTRVRAGDGTTTTVLRSRRASAHALSMALSPGHDMLAISHSDATVGLFSYPEGRFLRTLVAPAPTSLYRIAFAPGGDRLAAGGGPGAIYQWNPGTGKPLGTLPHRGSVAWVSFTEQGNRLVAAYRDGDANLVAGSGTPRPVRTTQSRYGWGSAVPDGAGGFYVGFADGRLARYTGKLEPVRDLPVQHTTGVSAMALSPDTHLLATTSRNEDDTLLTDPGTGAVLLRLPGTDIPGGKASPFFHGGYVSLAFTADGHHLVLGTTSGHTEVVHLAEDALRSRVGRLATTKGSPTASASDLRCS